MRGRGNIEFLSCKDIIISMIDQGYSVKKIYDKLYSEGKLSVKYAYFHRILSRNGIRRLQIEPLIRKNQIIVVESTSQSSNQIRKHESKSSLQSHEKKTTTQPLPQSSPGKKPTFEIIRLGDEAFENME